MRTIEKNICDAIEMFVDRGVETAPYDYTIQCKVIENSGAAEGRYLLKYQYSVFEAQAANRLITFKLDSMVSVLIPRNNLNDSHKIILGASDENAIEKFAGWTVKEGKLISSDGSFVLDPEAGLFLYSNSNRTQKVFGLNFKTHSVETG